jgi:hypothetical protein
MVRNPASPFTDARDKPPSICSAITVQPTTPNLSTWRVRDMATKSDEQLEPMFVKLIERVIAVRYVSGQRLLRLLEYR